MSSLTNKRGHVLLSIFWADGKKSFHQMNADWDEREVIILDTWLEVNNVSSPNQITRACSDGSFYSLPVALLTHPNDTECLFFSFPFWKKIRKCVSTRLSQLDIFFFFLPGGGAGVAAVVLFHFTHQVTSGYSFSLIISILQQKSWEKAS